jgi:hypothetical protein
MLLEVGDLAGGRLTPTSYVSRGSSNPAYPAGVIFKNLEMGRGCSGVDRHKSDRQRT